jgi:hypothetical protein
MNGARITTGLYIATACAAVVAAVYLARSIPRLASGVAAGAKAAGAAVVDAIDPTSSTNLASRAANAVFSVAADVSRGDTLGTNVDTIGTATYGTVERFMSWLTGTPTAGQIATAPSLPRASASAFGSIDLGEYADTVAGDDAAAGAWMQGFQVDGTAPAYINYSASFSRRGTFQ